MLEAALMFVAFTFKEDGCGSASVLLIHLEEDYVHDLPYQEGSMLWHIQMTCGIYTHFYLMFEKCLERWISEMN